MNIILATESPQRIKLFKKLNIPYIHMPSKFDENLIKKTNNHIHYCKQLAQSKAKSLSNIYVESFIIGADTIVVKNKKIFEKPNSKKEAFKMLKNLSNSKHAVYTSFSIQNKKNNLNKTYIEKTLVEFKAIDTNLINYYINNFNPLNKSGGYGIQNWGLIFIKKINGCYYNIVGLPLSILYEKLITINPDFKPLNQNNN